jgi:uncharacterized protein
MSEQADPLNPLHDTRGQMMDFMGREFYPFDPKLEDIRLNEIAVMLSLMRRYTSQSAVTVAQHSVIVSEMLEQEDATVAEQVDGLLHDAHEAYIGDFPAPLKKCMTFWYNGQQITYDDLAQILDATIYGKLLPQSCRYFMGFHSARLKYFDRVALLWEARDILRTPLPWAKNEDYVLPEEQLMAWSSHKARERFLERYRDLSARTGA